MSITEARSEANQALNNETITVAEYTAICKALEQAEYRARYNQRPDVKAKRAAYNKARNAEIRNGRELLRSLTGDR